MKHNCQESRGALSARDQTERLHGAKKKLTKLVLQLLTGYGDACDIVGVCWL